MKLLLQMLTKKRSQATTELAVTGVVVIMLLTYLLQRAYIYNCRQSLEMYTFRRALQLSQQQERGITLTVIRDVVIPSFFSGIHRQRLMSTVSVEYNPWMIYEPDNPKDLPTRYLLQIGEAMIRNNYYFEVPPTRMKIKSSDSDEDKWLWYVSKTSAIDSPVLDSKKRPFARTENYTYITHVTEAKGIKSVEKNLTVFEKKPIVITFKTAQEIKEDFEREDWQGDIESIEIDASTIPKDIKLLIEQTIQKKKVSTTH